MRLFFLFFSLAATALAGIGIIAVLAAGLTGWQPIVYAGALGVALAVPATWLITRKIAAS